MNVNTYSWFFFAFDLFLNVILNFVFVQKCLNLSSFSWVSLATKRRSVYKGRVRCSILPSVEPQFVMLTSFHIPYYGSVAVGLCKRWKIS